MGSIGGKNDYSNMQLLHRHCHDKKTASDGSLGKKSGCNSAKPKPVKAGNRGINDNDLITEEPCEVKVSSTVLQTSGSREGIAQFNGYAKRVTYVIDGNGKITHVDSSVNTSTHASDVLAALGL